MENYPVTKLEIIIRNDELEKCKSSDLLQGYLYDVVSPVICNALFTVPKNEKNSEISGGIRCSTDRGCDVHVGGTIRF